MEEKTILIDNLIVNYKIAGEGEPFLVLHGWGSNSERWQRVAELLTKKGFNIIIPDLPGFGKTQEPSEPWELQDYCDFVKEFVAALNLEKFYLLGHSFGGAVAVKFSLKFSKRIEKLFLVAATCIRKKTIKKWMLARISKFFKIFSFLPFYPLVRKAFYKFVVSGSDYQYEKGTMKESFRKVVNEDLSKVLTSIKVPTVIVWGAKDDTTLVEDAYFIEKEINNSKLIIIPEGDHDLEQKNPGKLVEIILEFLVKNNG